MEKKGRRRGGGYGDEKRQEMGEDGTEKGKRRRERERESRNGVEGLAVDGEIRQATLVVVQLGRFAIISSHGVCAARCVCTADGGRRTWPALLGSCTAVVPGGGAVVPRGLPGETDRAGANKKSSTEDCV